MYFVYNDTTSPHNEPFLSHHCFVLSFQSLRTYFYKLSETLMSHSIISSFATYRHESAKDQNIQGVIENMTIMA